MGNATSLRTLRGRHVGALVASAALVAAPALMALDRAPTVGAPGGPVVMVVGTPFAPTAGDVAVQDRLEGLGHVVTLVDDNGVSASVSDGAAFVLIASSVSSSAVGSTFRDVAEPVWVAKPWSLDNMAMTGLQGGVDYGVVSSSFVTVLDASHPLAGEFTGDVQITPRSMTMSFGQPGSEADVVTSAAGRPSTFLYEAGSRLANGSVAAGCRVHASIFKSAPVSFTADGWALFDAVASHVASECDSDGSEDASPSVDITQPANGATVSGSVAIRADATDDVGVTQVAFSVNSTPLGIDVDATDGWSTTWDTTTGLDGSAVLTAVATDTIGQTSSDLIVVTVHNLPDPEAFAILISVDGLRPDIVAAMGPTELPNLDRFMVAGATTLNARSTYDSTSTLPNHTSMITAVPVLGASGHGVSFNEDNGLTVHDAAGRYVAGIFDVAHDNGMSTGLFAGKPKFDFLDRSWNGFNGAPDTTGTDNGRDKIDHYERGGGGSTTPSFVDEMTTDPFVLSFVHYAEPDSAGHGYGWDSAQYEQSLRTVDAWVGQVLDLVETDPALAGKTTVVLTSDHGGTGTSHADAALAVNYTIPFLAWGPDVSADQDLYAINTTTRLDPGIGRPDHDAVPQPIRNADAGNELLEALGLGPVPGSTINPVQDLELIGSGDTPPDVMVTAPDAGATVAGDVTVMAAASDDVGVVVVEFRVAGVLIGSDDDGTDGWSVVWASTTVPDGSVTVSATALDTAGQPDTDSISVSVNNDVGEVAAIVMVVGNAGSPASGDAAVRDHLTARGFDVTLVDDGAATAGDAADASFVFVASSVSSSAVGNIFLGVDTPVWIAKPWLLDDMRLTGTRSRIDYGVIRVSSVTIVDGSHPLAGGFAGPVTLTPTSQYLSFAVPAGGADLVATAAGSPTTFVYQQGSALADGSSAAGCRIHVSAYKSTVLTWTTDAWALFDAATDFAASGCS